MTMPDNSPFTEEQRAEAFRLEHARHLQRQTEAIESIKNYVAIWFWLSIAGVVIWIVAAMPAANGGF